jgi:outer membrane immunogenic protein
MLRLKAWERRMKKKFALGAMLTALAAGTADAADYARGPMPYAGPLSTFSWMGPYIGANLGYQWGTATNSAVRPDGLLGGIQGGYNWQSGQFVLGGEADLQFSGASDVFAAWKFANPWFGTMRGRAGFAMNNILVYATGGLAFGGGRAEFAGLRETQMHLGWTVGAGLEVGFTPNWSAKVEYLFVDLSERNYSIIGTTHGFESSVFRFGVNYRF